MTNKLFVLMVALPASVMGAQKSAIMMGCDVGSTTMFGSVVGQGTVAPKAHYTGDAKVYADGTVMAHGIIDWHSAYGYQAHINTLTGPVAPTRFAGSIDMHYVRRHGNVGAGFYGGVGLNRACIASHACSVNSINVFQFWSTVPGVSPPQPVPLSDVMDQATYRDAGLSSLPHTVSDAPRARVSVSSGLTFQVGTRWGIWVNHVFVHARIGWQALQLTSKVSNVYGPYARSLGDVQGSNTQVQNNELNIGYLLNQSNNADYSNVTVLPSETTSFYRKKWANAVTLGGGFDVVHKKTVFGFYYQAAICQKVRFKYDDFVLGPSQLLVSGNAVSVAADDSVPNMKAYTVYGARPAQVSIQPVISTFMASVKYVFHKG